MRLNLSEEIWKSSNTSNASVQSRLSDKSSNIQVVNETFVAFAILLSYYSNEIASFINLMLVGLSAGILLFSDSQRAIDQTKYIVFDWVGFTGEKNIIFSFNKSNMSISRPKRECRRLQSI